jgi:hypothetical protein
MSSSTTGSSTPLSLCCSLNVRETIYQAHMKCKRTVLCFLIVMLLDSKREDKKFEIERQQIFPKFNVHLTSFPCRFDSPVSFSDTGSSYAVPQTTLRFGNHSNYCSHMPFCKLVFCVYVLQILYSGAVYLRCRCLLESRSRGISYMKYVNGRRTGLVTFCIEISFYNGLLKEGYKRG